MGKKSKIRPYPKTNESQVLYNILNKEIVVI